MSTGTNNSNNNPLTLVLYALLAGLLLAVGYKACQMKKEKALTQQNEAEMQQALRDLGYTDDDSTGTSASSGHATDEEADKASARYKDGTAENKTSTDVVQPQTHATETDSKKAATINTEDEEGKSVKVVDLDNSSDSSPQYLVITGSFTKLAGARVEMEKLVKMGYTEAEVGKFNRGKFACAIALRTDDLAAAKSTVAKLKAKGFKTAFVKGK